MTNSQPSTLSPQPQPSTLNQPSLVMATLESGQSRPVAASNVDTKPHTSSEALTGDGDFGIWTKQTFAASNVDTKPHTSSESQSYDALVYPESLSPDRRQHLIGPHDPSDLTTQVQECQNTGALSLDREN
eukprot:CAMPEP_0184328680 /NCGR_PEP_ID=MMETSP1049-20130417/143750_1 /TAXON_ID=77928 /ORGANISM="Proteomonas sulcata, Strain CCMP704" /LENGTH=129 /DNA_ID=CAMNT_0026651005 /DNA_START=636 /DNA_END=1027 /DNA_ORIENTATION=+